MSLTRTLSAGGLALSLSFGSLGTALAAEPEKQEDPKSKVKTAGKGGEKQCGKKMDAKGGEKTCGASKDAKKGAEKSCGNGSCS